MKNNEKLVIDINKIDYMINGIKILDNISLQIWEGDFLAIIGPNGGGKTTLLKLILGTVKNTSGSICHFLDRKNKRYGYLPQRTESPYHFPANLLSIVLMGKNERVSGKDSGLKDKAADLLHRVGMYEYRHSRFDELSGGQKQRVLLARAIIDDPDVLLLDEPLANIDPYGRQCILEILQTIMPKVTIIMVSHDLGITAHSITRLAAVNVNLEVRNGNKPSESMMRLMYGIHDKGCLHWPTVE